jgi:hypothetical protein
MIKKIFILLLTMTSLFANEAYLSEMDSLISDSKKIESALVDKSLASLSTDSTIKAQISAYELKTTAFLETLSTKITDPSLATDMLSKTETLTKNTVALSNSLVALADKTSTNANSSYLSTLDTLTKTTLRLSDDIGLMADRIGDMAGDIGEMADRIVESEKLINDDIALVNKSMMSVVEKFDFEQPTQNSVKMPEMSMPDMAMPVAPPSMPTMPSSPF